MILSVLFDNEENPLRIDVLPLPPKLCALKYIAHASFFLCPSFCANLLPQLLLFLTFYTSIMVSQADYTIFVCSITVYYILSFKDYKQLGSWNHVLSISAIAPGETGKTLDTKQTGTARLINP